MNTYLTFTSAGPHRAAWHLMTLVAGQPCETLRARDGGLLTIHYVGDRVSAVVHESLPVWALN